MCAFKQKPLFLEISLYLLQCTLIISCLFAALKSNEASALIVFWNRMKVMLTIVYYSYKTSVQLQKLFCAISLNISLQTLMHRCCFFWAAFLCNRWNLMLCLKQLWCYRRFKRNRKQSIFSHPQNMRGKWISAQLITAIKISVVLSQQCGSMWQHWIVLSQFLTAGLIVQYCLPCVSLLPFLDTVFTGGSCIPAAFYVCGHISQVSHRIVASFWVESQNS